MAVPEGRLKGHTGSMDAALGDGTIQKTYGQANRQHKYLSHGSDRRPFAASIENYPVSVGFDRRGMRRWVTAPSNSSSGAILAS